MDLAAVGTPEFADALLGHASALVDWSDAQYEQRLEEAIQQLEQAEDLFKRFDDEVGWREATIRRCHAISELVGNRRYELIDTAIKDAEALLKDSAVKLGAAQRGNLNLILGTLYQDRLEGEPSANLDAAETAYRQGLQAFRRAKDPNAKAQIYLQLATVCFTRVEAGDFAAVGATIRYARKARTLVSDVAPVELKTGIISVLARAYAAREGREWVSNFKKAEELLAEGISLADAQESVAGALLHLIRAQIFVHLSQHPMINRLPDAIEDHDVAGRFFSLEDTPQWWFQHREVAGQIAGMLDQSEGMIEIAEDAFSAAKDYLGTRSSHLERRHILSLLSLTLDLGVLGYLEHQGPVEGLLFARRLFGFLSDFDPTPIEHGPNAAEIHFLNPATENYGSILLAFGDDCIRYPLEGLGFEAWEASRLGELKDAISGLAVLSDPGGVAEFADHIQRWIHLVSGNLDPVTSDIVDEGFEEIIVFASGPWSTFPVSAIQLPGPEGRLLVDQARVLHGPCAHQEENTVLDRVLHLCDPKLDQSYEEAALIKGMSKSYTPVDRLSDIQHMLSSGEQFDLIHVTCHGQFNPDYPDGSGVICPDGEILTALWIYEHAHLQSWPLVCIAACLSGVPDFESMPHEGFGLPSAFIKAGARAVLGTQWPVDDFATRLFVQEFYSNIKNGMLASRSFHQTQKWMRSLEEAKIDPIQESFPRFIDGDSHVFDEEPYPFRHPYFWAGFTLHLA
ncbi:CHAT domain-containing protein [Marinovum sp. 2_MG-2023]|nr:CHAT domain-containing protein [Marinovum sp. 2_MG-2023]